jgi:hypothetical protein
MVIDEGNKQRTTDARKPAFNLGIPDIVKMCYISIILEKSSAPLDTLGWFHAFEAEVVYKPSSSVQEELRPDPVDPLLHQSENRSTHKELIGHRSVFG